MGNIRKKTRYGLFPCPWILPILCCIVPGVLSTCLGRNMTVSMYPENDMIVQYGHPLEIFCTAEGYSSDDLEFRASGVIVESEKINGTTRRLYFKYPEKQRSVYYCRNKKTSKKCVKRVLVDSPPAVVTDFTCVSRNYDVLNCSWTTPQMYTYTRYFLTFTSDGYTAQPECTAQCIGLTCYCTWTPTTQPRYRQMSETIDFVMASCNMLGCNNQTFTVDHCSILKPGPPSHLSVVKIEPHSAILKWKIPNNLLDFSTCQLDHVIEYQMRQIDNATSFHRVDSSSLPSRNRTYRLQLKNLPYANMAYEVRIYIKVNNVLKLEHWSDFNYIVFNTASERPSKPPETITGAFDQSKSNGKRDIYVYWKQIEEYEKAGPSFTYKLIYTQGNKTFPVVMPAKEKSLSYAVLKDVSLEALDVYVWSLNTNGSSLTSSSVHIPSEKERKYLNVTSFTKLAYGNGTYQLFWDGTDNIDNYTLFWCHDEVSRICLGMDFAVLDARKSNHVIDLPKEHRYQFAIAANKGASTTGMVWATCDISREGLAMYRTLAYLDHDAPGKSSVRLSWRMDCALYNGLIVSYKITYCPIDANGSCKSNESHTYIADPQQMNVVIENLNSFTTYQFTLSSNTIDNEQFFEVATTVLTTLE